METQNLPQTDPQTLMEAVKHFANLDTCHAYMVRVKWPDGRVTCPKCQGERVGYIASRRAFQCKDKACRKQFTTKVGTIFEDSPLGMDKWLVAIWCIVNAKNGISSCELARAIGVTQKSAWHMLHRIRLAMRTESFRKITGEVEADETFIGGKYKNMRAAKRREKSAIFGQNKGKLAVHGLLERGGDVRVKAVKRTNKATLDPIVRANVEPGSTMMTDIGSHYSGLYTEYLHEVVNHAMEYARGRVHTNGLENFWALLKRTISGTYVAIAPEHLQAYLDEQSRRFNLRHSTDGLRFLNVLRTVVGRRLTYKDLIATP